MFDNMYRILKNCSEHNYCHKVYSNNSKKYFQKRVFKVFRILFNFFWNKCTYIYIYVKRIRTKLQYCIFIGSLNRYNTRCIYEYNLPATYQWKRAKFFNIFHKFAFYILYYQVSRPRRLFVHEYSTRNTTKPVSCFVSRQNIYILILCKLRVSLEYIICVRKHTYYFHKSMCSRRKYIIISFRVSNQTYVKFQNGCTIIKQYCIFRVFPYDAIFFGKISIVYFFNIL